ncbi:MAG: radical SAM protein [Planctomycetes bacterium]|nr:radical SAM protein [Planctomycetota bacterium]
MGALGRIAHAAARVWDRSLDTLILFVTNACGMKCPFCCYAENLNQADDIPTDAMGKIARSIGPFRSLLCSGGEPFLRKDLAEVVRLFRAHAGVETVNIPTSGYYEERVAGLVESFFSSEESEPHGTLLNITVSLDGMAEYHDRQRGLPRTFEKAGATLDRLRALRERFPLLRTRVTSVVVGDNLDEIDRLIDHVARNHEVDEHGIGIARDLHVNASRHERHAPYVDGFHRLVHKTSVLYNRRGTQNRPKRPALPAGLMRHVTSALDQVYADVVRGRVHGHPWPFPCVAGESILVIDGAGSLKACELRDEVADLRQHDFDVRAALASGAMKREVEAIRGAKCDCIHGCFIGASMNKSPRQYLTRLPARVARSVLTGGPS